MSPDGFAMIGTARIALLRNGLRIMALRALGDGDAAEDVVQEALLRALRAVTEEIAADPDRLGAFVGGIARHVIADVKRTAARYTTQDGTVYALSTAPDALTALLEQEEQARVRTAIESLRASDQIIIRMSFYEGLTPTEVAERLDQPPERIRKRKSRALVRLRAVLDTYGSHESVRSASIKAETDTAMLAEGGA